MEVVTRREPRDPSLKLDRILTRGSIDELVRDVRIEGQWNELSAAADAGLADHAPIWFTLDRL
jgi:hypothetical protein